MKTLQNDNQYLKHYIFLNKPINLIVIGLIITCFLISRPAITQAASALYVSSTGDDNYDCLSLVAACRTISSAISKANSGDTIIIASGIYIENVTINKNLTLEGAGKDITTIDGGDAGRVLLISDGAVVSIVNITITNGHVVNDWGGGIFNSESTLFIANCTVKDNKSSGGGGVANINGTLKMDSCLITGNDGDNNGGGIANVFDGTVELINSHIRDNRAISGGGIRNDGLMYINHSTIVSNTGSFNVGGIMSLEGRLVITDSIVSDNYSGWGAGGILNNHGDLIVNETLISNNYAVDRGGGISNISGNEFVLKNSTISGNSVDDYMGGGIFNLVGTFSLINSTIVNNSAPAGDGGGIAAGGTMILTNTIIANSPSGGDCTTWGSVTSNGHNLDSDNTCGLTASDIKATDPLLGPLQDNGGTTFTHALLPHSPARDSGNNVDCSPVDQRGQTRPADGDDNGSYICDIGAFEAHLIQVAKSANVETARLGEIITYTYNIDNLSSNDLINIAASDNRLGTIDLPFASLTSGASMQGVLTHTTDIANLPGPLTNTVTVTATTQPTGTVVTITDDASVRLRFNPAIIITKVTDKQVAEVDDIITYTYGITNSGDVDLTNITAVDSLFGPLSLNLTDLTPNQSMTGIFTYTVLEEDMPGLILDSTAVVTGTVPNRPDILVNAVSHASVTLGNIDMTNSVYLPVVLKRD